MKKNLFAFCLVIVSFLGMAQSNAPVKKKSREEIINTELGQTIQVQANSQPSTSPYFGLEDQIKAIMISNSIPSGFPTKKADQSKSDYESVLNSWIKDHSEFIKLESKNFIFNNTNK